MNWGAVNAARIKTEPGQTTFLTFYNSSKNAYKKVNVFGTIGVREYMITYVSHSSLYLE